VEVTKLAIMVDLIENGNNNPVQCFTYIKKLASLVDTLMQTPKEWAQIFFSKDPIEQLQIVKEKHSRVCGEGWVISANINDENLEKIIVFVVVLEQRKLVDEFF